VVAEAALHQALQTGVMELVLLAAAQINMATVFLALAVAVARVITPVV